MNTHSLDNSDYKKLDSFPRAQINSLPNYIHTLILVRNTFKKLHFYCS